MPSVPLYITGIVTLNASGNGTAKVGPLSARETWHLGSVSIKTSTAVLEAECNVYVGPDTTQSNFRDNSVFGSSGDSSAAVSQDVIKSGFYVWAVWTGGDAGATATLAVTGTKDV